MPIVGRPPPVSIIDRLDPHFALMIGMRMTEIVMRIDPGKVTAGNRADHFDHYSNLLLVIFCEGRRGGTQKFNQKRVSRREDGEKGLS